MARLNKEDGDNDDCQEEFLSKTTIIAMIISNMFWILMISSAVLMNLWEKESSILRNWNYLIIGGCGLSLISLALYLKWRNSVLLMGKILIRSSLGILFIIVLIGQYFTKYNSTYSKTIQYFDLAFAICEFIYLCFMLTSVDNYYYEQQYKKEKLKRNNRQYNDYSSI